MSIRTWWKKRKIRKAKNELRELRDNTRRLLTRAEYRRFWREVVSDKSGDGMLDYILKGDE